MTKLLDFIQGITRLVEANLPENLLVSEGSVLLKKLVEKDDWLPEAYAKPHADFYKQYLLYADPLDRLSVVSFVWGPGQKTPVHDHLTWGLVGCLRGREKQTTYTNNPGQSCMPTETSILLPGQVYAVSPELGDIHEVANDLPDQPSISIHVYGRNIGRVQRHVFDLATGAQKTFVSNYANETVPNLWFYDTKNGNISSPKFS